jgi:hypothetical protein
LYARGAPTTINRYNATIPTEAYVSLKPFLGISSLLAIVAAIILLVVMAGNDSTAEQTQSKTSNDQISAPATQQDMSPDSREQLYAAIEANAPYAQRTGAAQYAKTPMPSLSGMTVPSDAQSAIGYFASGRPTNETIQAEWISFRASLQEKTSSPGIFSRGDAMSIIAYLDYQENGDAATVEALFCYGRQVNGCTSDKLADIHLEIVLEPRYWNLEYVDLQVASYKVLD